MCDLYYLDQYREEIFARKLAENIEAVRVAVGAVGAEKSVDGKVEEIRRATKTSLKALSERTAKLALDLAFIQVINVHNDNAAKKRLLRYAIELCFKTKDNLDV